MVYASSFPLISSHNRLLNITMLIMNFCSHIIKINFSLGASGDVLRRPGVLSGVMLKWRDVMRRRWFSRRDGDPAVRYWRGVDADGVLWAAWWWDNVFNRGNGVWEITQFQGGDMIIQPYRVHSSVDQIIVTTDWMLLWVSFVVTKMRLICLYVCWCVFCCLNCRSNLNKIMVIDCENLSPVWYCEKCSYFYDCL